MQLNADVQQVTLQEQAEMVARYRHRIGACKASEYRIRQEAWRKL